MSSSRVTARSTPLALLLAAVALALGVGTLIVALTQDDGGSLGGMMSRGTTRAMMGTRGHGRFTARQLAAAAKGTVYVRLGDAWVASAVASIHAGTVTFEATNVGRRPHELMIARMPLRFDSPTRPALGAAQGMIGDMRPGRSGRMTVRLTPGMYMLFCNASGHFAAGQHTMLRVTA